MYTIKRSGDFYATPVGQNHCGLQSVPHRFLYEVSISCLNLDERGFLVDQLDIKAYFDTLENVQFSCEQLAEQVARHFITNVSQCDAITVVISPTTRSEAEARFELSESRLPKWKHENGYTEVGYVVASHLGDM